MKKFVVVFFTVFMSFTIFSGVASAATSGTGWIIKTNSNGQWNLRHNTQYKIRFVNQDSRLKIQPYLGNSIDYLNNMSMMKSAGISFVMVDESYGLSNFNDENWCGNDFGVFTFVTKTSPTSNNGESVTHSCYSISDNASWGGYSIMDADYWKVAPSHERTKELRNIHAHELGHLLGLGHPDISKISGLRPVMFGSPVGGYQDWQSAGKYTQYDVGGIHQLIRGS